MWGRNDVAHRPGQHWSDIPLLRLLDKARQGKAGCKGRTIQMDRLDHLVVDHIEGRLLRPTRLETILSSVIDRRQERTERRREHLAELHRRITEADQRLDRLFDTIEAGMVDKDDAMAKERMVSLKALRDQADDEVRIMGLKSELLRTLIAASSVEMAAFGVQSSVLKWRTGENEDENFELEIVRRAAAVLQIFR